MAAGNRLRILLTHTSAMRANYYGPCALAALQAIGDMRVNEGDKAWDGNDVVEAAAGCDIIVADRQTSGDATVFDSLAQLVAFVRVAVDVRNFDGEAPVGAVNTDFASRLPGLRSQDT